MAKGKIDKATAIKSILSDLKKGVGKPVILQKLSKNYTNSTKSFYNYFEAAEIEYKKFLDKAQPIIEAKEIEALGEIAKAGILSKAERMQLLSDIANGTKKVWKQVATAHGIETVESYEPSKYIDLLNKMDGAYISDIDSEEKITEIKITRINGA